MVSAKVCLLLLLCALIATDNASGCIPLKDESWERIKQHVETNMATMGVMTSAVDYFCDDYYKYKALTAHHAVFKRAVHKSKEYKIAGARNGEPENMTSLQDEEQEWLFLREVMTRLFQCGTLQGQAEMHCDEEISSIRKKYPRMSEEEWKEMKQYMDENMETMGVATAMLTYISELTNACEKYKEDGRRHAVSKRAVHESKGHKRNGEPGKKRSIQVEEGEWDLIRVAAENTMHCGNLPSMYLYCTGEVYVDFVIEYN